MSDKLLNMPGIPTIGATQNSEDVYQQFMEDTNCRATILINWFHDGTVEYSVHANRRIYADGNLTVEDFIAMLEKAANTLMDAIENEEDEGAEVDA